MEQNNFQPNAVPLIGSRQAPDGMTIRELDVLVDLEPVVEENYNRHLKIAKVWMPHDYVPWDQGRNFKFLGGEDWEPGQSALSPIAKKAMILNLLTEDNLPSYHRTIFNSFNKEGAWRQWAGRWTAEEGRHGIALRDYLVITRGVDPVALELARMEHMTKGYETKAQNPLEVLAYVSFQELATRVSHRNTGKACGDPIADKLLARIAMDENLHMLFYRNVVKAAFDRDPNATMEAVKNEVIGFQMPGEDVPEFSRTSLAIANAEIYSPTQHLEEVLWPVLREWNFETRDDLTGDGEKAREELSGYLGELAVVSSTFEERLAKRKARQAERGETVA